MSHNHIYKAPVGTKLDRGVIIPVFLPFAGCPFQCIYCLQDKQTGVGQISISDALQKLENDVRGFVDKKLNLLNVIDKIEIAFYGGTFTALQESDLLLCLDVFKKIKKQLATLNIKVFGRCSTRPDCLGFDDFNDDDDGFSTENSLKDTPLGKKEEIILEVNKISAEKKILAKKKIFQNASLLLLKKAGIDLIELGIQSFDNKALVSIGRGYSSDVARAACRYIKALGFELGIQLMPGIPNQSVETFHNDVNIALGYKPACMRYYPCLVPEGTGLAKLWRAKEFVSWDLATCVDALGYALHLAWQKEIPVIRLSVAPELAFDTQILAGVRHPALGSLIQAQALLYFFEEAKQQMELEEVKQDRGLDEAKPYIGLDNVEDFRSHKLELHSHKLEFHVPKNVQGFIFGEKNGLKEIWENLVGIDNIIFDAEDFEKGIDSDNIVFNAEGFQTRTNLDSFTTKFAFLCKKKDLLFA